MSGGNHTDPNRGSSRVPHSAFVSSPARISPREMAPASPPHTAATLRSVDRDLLHALRECAAGESESNDSADIGQLTRRLGVTATAVRQRIDRLLDLGLIDREKVVVGRGRPTFRYRLTVEGYRRSGADAVALADAMWREILALPDESTRNQLLRSVANRLGKQFAAKIGSAQSFSDRIQDLTQLLATRQVDATICDSGQLPVLDICSCPYPSLTDASDDRSMCRLEEEVFSQALGTPVQLSQCRLDGDACCQFTPVETSTESH